MKTKTIRWKSIAMALLIILGSSAQIQAQTNPNTVSVNGRGSVSAKPDVAIISLSISHRDSTTRRAKASLDRTISQILQILKAEKIQDNQIKTNNLSFNTEYEYSEGRGNHRTIAGQKAEQSLMITITDIQNKPEVLSNIIDKVIINNDVAMDNLSFKTTQTESLYQESRALAFAKARSKAEEYAEHSGRKLGKVLSIVEYHSQDVATRGGYGKNYSANEALLSSAPTYIPSGEESISSEVSVVFELE